MTNKILFFVAMLLNIMTAFAQSPNMINYQGVARQLNGTAIANQSVSIRLSIHHATANGTVQYSESRNVTTDAEGLFDLQIGSSGTISTTGSFSGITWESGAKYLQVEMDAAGGTNYINMGTQQLVSVPYAQHANKASALIPTATINPNQLTAGGATTNQVLKYNGSNWVPGTSSDFALPFIDTDSSSVSFKVNNNKTNFGTAIHGLVTGSGSTNRGVYGQATGSNGVGVYGQATGSNGIGLEGYTSTLNGLAVYGRNVLGGLAIKGTTNTSSSSVAAIFGESTGTSGIGVEGNSDGATGIGVYGESVNGMGVMGYGNNVGSVAVYGSALAGTGVSAYSYTGYALESNGKIKIAGNNTNPSNGAVLTSDASGNATWKINNISFSANTAVNTAIPEFTQTKVEFSTEDHDIQNNFLNYAGVTTTNSSKFTAPIAGVYHFSAAVSFFMISGVYNFNGASIFLVKNGVAIGRVEGIPDNGSSYSRVSLNITRGIHLNLNDKVWIEVNQSNSANTSQALSNDYYHGNFSGHLLFAD